MKSGSENWTGSLSPAEWSISKHTPDYMTFETENKGIEEYPIRYYTDILQYIQTRYAGQYWHVCPGELAEFFFEHADQKPWPQTNGEILCPSCRSVFDGDKVHAFSVCRK